MILRGKPPNHKNALPKLDGSNQPLPSPQALRSAYCTPPQASALLGKEAFLPADDFWVFAYGSLMWRPGFSYDEKHITYVHGYHRRLCVYSCHHRGTPEKPGLVMGLVPGGTCKGMAYRVNGNVKEETLNYLFAREMVTSVYHPHWVFLRVGGISRKALTFKVKTSHIQFTGHLPYRQIRELVRQGEGLSGRCLDYVMNTHRHLDELGIKDLTLSRLFKDFDVSAKKFPPG